MQAGPAHTHREGTAPRCPPPLRLALVWGTAAVVLAVLAVLLFFWTGWTTDSGMTCASPYDGSGAACHLYSAWASVLAVAGVLGAASVAAGTIGLVAARR